MLGSGLQPLQPSAASYVELMRVSQVLLLVEEEDWVLSPVPCVFLSLQSVEVEGRLEDGQ